MMDKQGKKTQRDIIMHVVEEVQDAHGQPQSFRCIADEGSSEKKCSYAQKSFLAGNFKRHLLAQHPGVAKELGFEAKESDESPSKKGRFQKLSVETSRREVLIGTILLVALHNLPLRFPVWEGSKKLLQPLWNAAGITMSRDSISGLIKDSARIMRELIAAEMCGRIVSLKIDSASRRGRSIFGINVQFIDENGCLQVRHLAIREMVERQTKVNLKKVIEEVMSDFGIAYDRLLTVAHDNGANMVAAVRLMKRLLVLSEEVGDVPLSEILQKEMHALQIIDSRQMDDNENDDVDDDEVESIEAEIIEEIQDDFSDGQEGNTELHLTPEDDMEELKLDMLESIRCGAHTAQLAVWDVIKPYKSRLASINKICLTMRQIAYRQLFTLHKVPLPPKVNETRWNIWFVLLRYLQTLQETPFLAVLQGQNALFDISRHWKFINKFCTAFEPMFNLTLRLQKEHVPLSQFYADWLICQAQLHALKNDNSFGAKLLTSMERRVEKLSTSMVFKACLYLDPRFNFAGSRRMSGADKSDVQRYLLALNKRLDDLAGITNSQVDENPVAANSDDYVEDYLACLFNEDTTQPFPEGPSTDTLLVDLVKLESRGKINISTSSVLSSVTPDSTPNKKNSQLSTSLSQPSTSRSPVNMGSPQNPASSCPGAFDIITYWNKRRFFSPRLHRLASVVLSAPSTQVTVERLFSQLKFIMSDSRMRLQESSIKDIMILKMNADLIPKVVDALEAMRENRNQ